MPKLMLNIAAASMILAIAPSFAEVTTVGERGFTVFHSRIVAADSTAVYQAIVEDISRWWDGDHSWSGDAANFYFDARPGGCFCERLPDSGGVEHLHIIYLAPAKEIRMTGALGPLQQMGVQGTMTWKMSAVENGSSISFEYIVGGNLPEGQFPGIAPAVDGVIGSQLESLVRLLESKQ